MVKVECDGCKSPYQVDEKRIPPTGLKMRCPKCGNSLLVTRTGQAHEDIVDLPAAPAPRKGGAPPPRRAAPPPPGPGAAHSDLPALAARGAPDFPPHQHPGTPLSGFGEIDLMVDLPPALSPDSLADLPVVQSVALPPGVRRPLSLPPGFEDEVDLPVVQKSDLPIHRERSFSEGGFGEIDLPVPSPGGHSAPPLRGFGEIDLPDAMAEPEMDLPSARDFSEIDLPLPGGGVGLPARTGAGLPMASPTGLPSVARGIGLPALGDAGLPATGGSGLPSPATAGLPTTSGSGLPTAATALGMPATATGSVVGAELYSDPPPPGRTATSGFPRAPSNPGTRDAGKEFNFGDSPQDSPDEFNFGDVHPLSDPPPPPIPNLTGRPPVVPTAAAFVPGGGATAPLGSIGAVLTPPVLTPPAHSGGGGYTMQPTTPAAGVGDELELGAGESGPVLEPLPVSRAPKATPAIELVPKKSNRLKYFLAGLVLVLIGGGAVALVPDIGPFGYNIISDKLNSSAHIAAFDELRRTTQENMALDTSAGAARSLDAAREAIAAAPRHRPTAAYGAYIAYARSIRFGRRTEDESFGKQLLTASEEQSDTMVLATAAQDAATGQLARARQTVAGLTQRAPDDIDAAVLTGEIELSAKVPDKAVAAWKRAVEIQKSARTQYGLARAQVAANDMDGAEASAAAALQLSPKHAGARTLLANIIWHRPAREAEALALLTKVTEEGDVRASASDAELVEASTLLGRVHLHRSRMSAAEQAFASALKLDPQAVQALIGNGELFYRSGRYNEALGRFEAAIRADADSVIAKVGAAKTWIALERMKEAKDLLKKLREAHPKDPLVAYWLGRAEEVLGNQKDAEAAYLDAVKIGDTRQEVVDAYVALARLLSARGRAEEAAAKLTEASTKFPESAALHKAKGEVSLQTGRYEDAKRELEAALAREEDLGTKFKLGVTNRRMRSFEEASKIFETIAVADKDYPGLALERGLLFEETNQSERALEMYADALRKAPNDVDLKLRVGSAQVMAGHAKQAEPILREVIKERANYAEANHFLGRALLVKGTNLSEAMRFLERAVEIDGNRAEYFLYVGWGANEAGQPARAADALKRALELDKELGDAYWQRGVLLQKQGRTLDALADLHMALEKRDSRYQAYATMALCYQDQSKWAEAEDSWRKAIAKDDTVSEWHYRLGKIYWNRNNRAGAAIELDRAITLAEAADRSQPVWLFDAHFLLAEAVRGTDKEKAIRHYRRFLETAPTDNAYRIDAEKALESLGSSKPR